MYSDFVSYGEGTAFRDHTQRNQITFIPEDFDFKLDNAKGPLKVPALIIWGEKDWMLIKDDQRVIPGAFDKSKCTLSLYPNAARTPWAEDPLRFFNEIRKLLDDCGIKKASNKKDKR